MDNYKEKKQQGIIIVDKIEGEELHISKKQFDVDSGEEVESKIDIFLQSTLLIRKAELEKELSEVNEMLKEFAVK